MFDYSSLETSCSVLRKAAAALQMQELHRKPSLVVNRVKVQQVQDSLKFGHIWQETHRP